jgi:integrase
MFNRYIKKVCQISGIDQIEKGNKFDSELKRTVYGSFPKYELISSHCCRRSFATNHYGDIKYPTPLLMSITGHSTEKTFLIYIGKKPINHSLQLAEIWSKEALKGNENNTLTVVKNSAANE